MNPVTRFGEFQLLERVRPHQHVLLAGAGGGYDVYASLPLYFALERMGLRVSLANLSFSNLGACDASRLSPSCAKVTADSAGDERYFPERALARWFRARGAEVPIFAFERSGVPRLLESYSAIRKAIDFDAIILVDGGTDILMRGDEPGLGTPAEDMLSLAAVAQLDSVETKLVASIGFGVDTFHGVDHWYFLEAVAALCKSGGFLGSQHLLPTTPEAQAYREAVAFGTAHSTRPSIVNTSIADAIAGEYGDVQRLARTAGSELWINPLMAQIYGFELQAVAARSLYLDRLFDTQNFFEVLAQIEAFRHEVKIRPRRQIPA